MPDPIYFNLTAAVFVIAIVAGITAIALQPTGARRYFRLILALFAIGSGIAVPIAAYYATNDDLIDIAYFLLGSPAALGIIALLRRKSVVESRGFEVIPRDGGSPGV